MGQDDWAIVVGIWAYPDLGNLTGPENDANAFADWVRSPTGGGVPENQIRLVLSSDFAPADSASRAEPTPGRVEALFDELDDVAQRNKDRMEGLRVGRRLYLYMAGHGCAPILDESVLLMANATRRRAGYHIPGKPWANWFYRAGYFDEILLFMDCCRENYPQAPLNLPSYIDVTAPDAVDRGRRFFAFGTKWSRLARERPMDDGTVRGVFTVALLEGLKGAAAEPDGRVTASSLAGYLQTNMKTFLTDVDRADPGIPKAPDMELRPVNGDDFVIVTVTPPLLAPPATQPVANGSSQSRLMVTTGDVATEIILVDGRLHVIAHAAGELQGDFDPGIYLIKIQAGETTREEYVTLSPGEEVTKAFPRLAFASSAPLADTALSNQQQREVVVAQSRQPHIRSGSGSEICVVVRDSVPPEQPVAEAGTHPGQGLALLSASGTTLVDLGTQSWTDSSAGSIGVCNVELDPGIYKLSLGTPDGGRLEQIVVASPGWQTQVFLLQRAHDANGGAPRIDLSGAAVFMSPLDRVDRFDSERPQNRLVELARQALASRRQILSPRLRETLGQNLDDPMLGIFGGHLLLLDPAPDLELLRRIVGNVRGMLVQAAHPDVEALALRLEPSAVTHVFEGPPMLRRSWTLALEASVVRPELVPVSSAASTIADRIWGEEPWLIWQSPPESQSEVAFGLPMADVAIEPNQFHVALRRQLAPQTRWSSATRRSATPDFEFAVGPADGDAPSSAGRDGEHAALAELDESEIRRLVATLGVPRARLEAMVAEGF
jgi:hypothetical protein